MENRISSHGAHLLWLTMLILLSGVCMQQCAALVQHERDNAALIVAIKQNNTSRVLDLLNHGADPNAVDHSDSSFSLWRHVSHILWYRVRGQNPPPETVPTALLTLCKASEDTQGAPILPKENLTILLALLERGAHVNAMDRAGYTALSYAIAYSHWATARTLVEHGADIAVRGFDDQPILTSAIYDPGLVRLLLKRGASVEGRSSTRSTALMVAAEYNESESVRQLLAKGAKIEATDDDGNTALMYAIEDYAQDCVRLLLQRGGECPSCKPAASDTAAGSAESGRSRDSPFA